MPITRKPKTPANGHLQGPALNALINKGGSPARGGRSLSFNASRGVDIPVIVRIPEADLMAVDSLVMRRPVKMPRHTWLLEAIHEKIVRERADAARVSAGKERRANG